MTGHGRRHGRDDHYYRLAKKEGYRSRSAYKLIQISEKHNLVRPGDVVLDLGCAPGGWMQVCSRLAGDEGYVLGIDKKPVEDLQKENTRTILADLTQSETKDLIVSALPSKADVVLSDLSPNVTGIWEMDHLNQIDLARIALSIARSVLRRDGRFLTKAFQGENLQQFVSELRDQFSNVKIVRTPATRKKSAEVYLLASGFRRG